MSEQKPKDPKAEGWDAFEDGIDYTQNPYQWDSEDYGLWDEGWNLAEDEEAEG